MKKLMNSLLFCFSCITINAQIQTDTLKQHTDSTTTYKIQYLSKTFIDAKHTSVFKNVYCCQNVECYNGTYYRYMICETTKISEIEITLVEIKKQYPDAFIVHLVNNKRIN